MSAERSMRALRCARQASVSQDELQGRSKLTWTCEATGHIGRNKREAERGHRGMRTTPLAAPHPSPSSQYARCLRVGMACGCALLAGQLMQGAPAYPKAESRPGLY